MIEIVEGSLEESKEETKKLVEAIRSRIKAFKKSVKPKERTKEQLRRIEKHEATIDFLRVSVMAPVQVEHIFINYKLYERFMKKLKGYKVTEHVNEDKLIVNYYKGTSKGELILYDLSAKLEGIDFFPKAVIVE